MTRRKMPKYIYSCPWEIDTGYSQFDLGAYKRGCGMYANGKCREDDKPCKVYRYIKVENKL